MYYNTCVISIRESYKYFFVQQIEKKGNIIHLLFVAKIVQV